MIDCISGRNICHRIRICSGIACRVSSLEVTLALRIAMQTPLPDARSDVSTPEKVCRKRVRPCVPNAIEITTMNVIFGGALKTPIIFPTFKDEMGVDCIQMSLEAKWLNLLCYGTVINRGINAAGLRNVLADMRAQLRVSRVKVREEIDEGHIGAQAIESFPDSDSDAEQNDEDTDNEDAEAEAQDDDTEKDRPGKKTKQPTRDRERASCESISVGGQTVLAKSGRGGAVIMVSDAASMIAFVDAVSKNDIAGSSCKGFLLRPSLQSTIGVDPRTLLESIDSGRVRWGQRESTFTVHWKAKDGGRARVTSRFAPPLTNYAGTPWRCEKHFGSVIYKTLLKARRAWDVLDQTSALRYGRQEDEEEDGSRTLD